MRTRNIYRQTEITRNRIDISFIEDGKIIKFNTYKIDNPNREKTIMLSGVKYELGTVRMNETDCPFL